jgi:CheY-like chemotaxis protein
VKVAIVDDDLWARLGRATGLAGASGYEVVEMAPRPAMAFAEGWDCVDVALVDAHDATEPFDRFPGVRVVEAIRERRDAGSTLVVVITGHSENAFLRLRMAEAGADFLYRHEDVRDLRHLVSVIERPDPGRRVARPDDAVLERLGLGPGSRPNAALRFLEKEGLEGVFDGQRSQKALDLSRRSIMRVRHEVARLADLSPTRPFSASRQLDAPEWRAVVDFVNRARGAERRNTGLRADSPRRPT